MAECRCGAGATCPFSNHETATCTSFAVVCEHRFYGCGRRLFTQGDPVHGVFATASGWIKQTFTSPTGRSVSLGISGPGTLLGLHEALATLPHASTAEAVADCELAYIDRSAFLQILGHDPAHAVEMLRVLGRHAERLFVELCEHRAGVPPLDRLRSMLRDLAVRCGSFAAAGVLIQLPLTVQDLADRIGCSRQWTSELLAELEHEGSIARRHGRIIVTRAGDVVPLTDRRQRADSDVRAARAHSKASPTHRGRQTVEGIWPLSTVER